MSYAGTLVSGLNADADAVGDLDVVVAGLETALGELRELAA